MKKLKKISISLSLMACLFMFTGCGKDKVEENGPNFKIVYESNKDVDKVIYKIGDYEGELNPMHEDKKVKKGYSSNANLTDINEGEFSIEIIDDGDSIYKNDNVNLDFSGNKKIIVSVIENDKSEFNIKVENK